MVWIHLCSIMRSFKTFSNLMFLDSFPPKEQEVLIFLARGSLKTKPFMLDVSMRVHEFKFRQTWYKPVSKMLPVMPFSTENPQCDIFQNNSDLIFVLK